MLRGFQQLSRVARQSGPVRGLNTHAAKESVLNLYHRVDAIEGRKLYHYALRAHLKLCFVMVPFYTVRGAIGGLDRTIEVEFDPEFHDKEVEKEAKKYGFGLKKTFTGTLKGFLNGFVWEIPISQDVYRAIKN